MRLLFKALIFFSFFSSFSLFNIDSMEWGLQVSWAIAILLFLLYPFWGKGVYRFPFNRNFKLITAFFVCLLILSLFDWLLLYNDIIHANDMDKSELLGRSIAHVVYLIFDYLVYFHLVCFLHKEKPTNVRSIRTFITYTFYFIVFWGVYQWLTTFELLPYWKVFNNNASTGFTYLRFVADHRSSSVFPEPSEYAYFLAFMLPFVYVQWRYRKFGTIYSHHPKTMLFTWFAAFITCQSMSLFLVFPAIYIYI